MLGHNSLNIAAYSARLLHLVTYLQQLEMESLGKRVAGDGQAVGVPSAPIIWGMPGTDGQHTFFQWLHQSENGAPVDFIASLQGCPDNPDAHRMLLANCLAQRQAPLRGKSLEQALLDVAHIDDRERALRLARHMVHPGGRPSSLISCASSTRVAWARCWPCTSTRCSCRAWSGASIPSTNGAWSWQRLATGIERELAVLVSAAVADRGTTRPRRIGSIATGATPSRCRAMPVPGVAAHL